MKKDFVYLASASPRRSELLRQIGVPFEVRPAEITKSRLAGEAPEAYVVRLAAAKAEAVWAAVGEASGGPCWPRTRPSCSTARARQAGGRGRSRRDAGAPVRPHAPRADGRRAARRQPASRRGSATSEVRFRATTAEERLAVLCDGRAVRQGGRLRHPGACGGVRRGVARQLFGRRRAAAVRDGGAARALRSSVSGSRHGRPDEARGDPHQRDVERGARRARRQRRAARGPDRAREPRRAHQQHL